MLRIAFAACNKNAARFGEDASFIYRCENLAHALRQQGHLVWLGHISALPWHHRWDAVVFHRPRISWRLRGLLVWLQRRGVRTVADVDDLIFDPALAAFSPGVVNGLVSLADTARQFQGHHQALARFGRITVSTEPLVTHLCTQFASANVAVIPNAVYWRWHDMPAATPADENQRFITYLPGTRSHDRDFATVAVAVERVLARHPTVQLRVTGPLSFALQARPGQVVHHAKLPFDRFHENLRGAFINLAPLESTPFTRCKSAIKVMEASWWNVPTVCSPLPDANRFAGIGAHIAETATGFEAELERLLTDNEHYAETTRGLRERVRLLVDVHGRVQVWLDFVFGGHVGAAA